MIQVEQLSKSYTKKLNRGFGFKKPERFNAISQVTFDALDGAITGLLGGNGAGKSTTLRIISTLINPDSGRVSVDGFDTATQPLEVRKNIGFLPHNAGIYPRLTAVENIRYYAEICGMSSASINKRVSELVERLGMSEFSERRTEGFSQGQRTKVALARALVHKPRTIILDEPTNGLDVMAIRSLREIIRDLKNEGHCILLSSHVMQEVAALCEHVVIIDAGKVVVSDSIKGIKNRTGCDDMEDAFVSVIEQSLEPSS